MRALKVSIERLAVNYFTSLEEKKRAATCHIGVGDDVMKHVMLEITIFVRTQMNAHEEYGMRKQSACATWSN